MKRARAYGRRMVRRLTVIALAAALVGLTAVLYRHTWEWFGNALTGAWCGLLAADQLQPWASRQEQQPAAEAAEAQA
jgi:F0F1-type ATP synthase assembly protein I